ncbi:superoxide dismutase family protein [Formosa sp. L2A11]|uniref:superoxide dismutase family protein n=1 Tax=Formosa sp. L2A11 TaxID=2686363 RepID=UPI00131D1216|nr:superoxide dismutase family protein [Formosa sp. L2A11]
MKIIKTVLIAVCIIGFTSCQNKKKKSDPMSDPTHTPNTESITNNAMKKEMDQTNMITVNLEPKSDSKVSGTVVFTEMNDTVKMLAQLEGLKPKTVHAIHLHEKADCSSPDGKSSGGHWNPTNSKHGKWGDVQGYHRGDIGNFTTDENGKATVTFETDEWCITCQDTTRTIGGRGIIIHQGTDDFTTQPTGDAGIRIACGAIQ